MNTHNAIHTRAKRHIGATLLVLTTLISGCDSGGGNSDPAPNNNGNNNPVTGSFTISGTIAGNNTSVTLSLNSVEETFTGSSFTFTSTVLKDDLYLVQFVSTPNNQVCIIGNSNGIIASDITNIEVTCSNPQSILNYDDVNILGGMTTGDFNGDGLVDLAFSIFTSPTHTLGSDNTMTRFVFGSGNGVFLGFKDIATIGLSGDGERGHASIALDFNNDGIDDLATNGNPLEIFSGNNSDNPLPLSNLGQLTSGTFYSFDADSNGFNDIISFNNGNPGNTLFNLHLNNGGGAFDPALNFPTAGSNPTRFDRVTNITIADFDGDGLEDILALGVIFDIALDQRLVLALFTSNGDGSFDVPVSFLTLSDDIFFGETISSIVSKEITFGDYDEDGDNDIVITSTTNYLQVLTNNGSGSFTESQRVTVGSEPIHVRTADFDNDGVLDLMSVNLTSKNIYVSFGNGDATFGDITGSADSFKVTQINGEVELRDVSITDVDLDGVLDVIVAESGTNLSTFGKGSIRIILAPGL